MNASYLKQLREQEHLIKQQNETLKDEREFFKENWNPWKPAWACCAPIAPASIPGRIQTPIPVLVTGQTHTVGAPPPVFATPTHYQTSSTGHNRYQHFFNGSCHATIKYRCNTESSSSWDIYAGTSSARQLEGIKFSNPDIPSSAVKRAGKLQLTHAQELCYNALVQEVWREVFNVERLNDFISYTPVGSGGICVVQSR
ncbi:hypothetical protein IW261DRAFT_1424046 [Armillaria novae-zelandiae]|uniref:Uncharacterized protein n=1 Tax=Armillaria novae-zelandiae TaxID=153914 RepID=A0AA39UBS3_9AGAR|nr:hypothetical protein IW261DRAFT_1424046 [Armillaria novae-zelandiae]